MHFDTDGTAQLSIEQCPIDDIGATVERKEVSYANTSINRFLVNEVLAAHRDIRVRSLGLHRHHPGQEIKKDLPVNKFVWPKLIRNIGATMHAWPPSTL